MKKDPNTIDFLFQNNRSYIDFDQLLDFFENCKINADNGTLFPEPYDELVKEQPGVIIATLHLITAILSNLYIECYKQILEKYEIENLNKKDVTVSNKL